MLAFDDPKLIAKYQRRFPDFDDKIISMYARGMSVREIRGHLEELYGSHRPLAPLAPTTKSEGLAFARMAPGRYSASGSSRPRVPSSGCASRTS